MTGPKPTRQQAETIKWMLTIPNPIFAEDVPREVAWYARDVLDRMLKRGWLTKAEARYEVTSSGRAAIGAEGGAG